MQCIFASQQGYAVAAGRLSCNLWAVPALLTGMIAKVLCVYSCCFFAAAPSLFAQQTQTAERPLRALAALQRVEVKVGETTREALVYAPAEAKVKAAPLVFVFHGHGGGMRQAALSFSMHTHWPEAIVVYPHGLPTVGRLTDPEGTKNGWQPRAGTNEDRDLKFFDALLAKLKADYKVDAKRIYSTGHSNGGGFTYLLWAERGDQFAAFAPSSAVMIQGVLKLKPKPVMHLAGEKDELVKYTWQQRMMEAVKKRDGCDTAGATWGENATRYESKGGTPVVTYIHSGGHEFARDAVPLVVKFFKEFALPEPKTP